MIGRVRGRKLYNYIVEHITHIPLIPRLGSLSFIQPSQPQFLQMPHPGPKKIILKLYPDPLSTLRCLNLDIIAFIHILTTIFNKYIVINYDFLFAKIIFNLFGSIRETLKYFIPR